MHISVIIFLITVFTVWFQALHQCVPGLRMRIHYQLLRDKKGRHTGNRRSPKLSMSRLNLHCGYRYDHVLDFKVQVQGNWQSDYQCVSDSRVRAKISCRVYTWKLTCDWSNVHKVATAAFLWMFTAWGCYLTHASCWDSRLHIPQNSTWSHLYYSHVYPFFTPLLPLDRVA